MSNFGCAFTLNMTNSNKYTDSMLNTENFYYSFKLI